MTDKKISPLTKKRYASEKRFKVYCVTALVLAMAILFTLLSSITVSSIPAFTQTHIEIDVYLDKEILDPNDTNDLQTILNEGPWRSLAKSSLREMIPGVTARKEKRELYGLVSIIAGDSIKSYVKENYTLKKVLFDEEKIYLKSQQDVINYYANTINHYNFVKNADNKDLEPVFGLNYGLYELK